MSWQAIAKKDFQDSVRSKTLWGVIAVFFLLIGGIAWLAVDSGADAADAIIGGTLGLGILFFVPLAGLFISIKSVVRERESGTINLLLSLPHSRGEMIAGKFLGRSAVIAAAILAGFIPAIVLILIETEVPVGDLAVFLFVTMLFGVMFVGIGVGFSALFNTETQGTIGGIIIFFALYLWPVVLDRVLGLVGQSIPTFLERFWLLVMFSDMVNALAPEGDGLTAASAVELGSEGSVPVYMQNWFVFVILAVWMLVPLAIGYFRFNSADI